MMFWMQDHVPERLVIVIVVVMVVMLVIMMVFMIVIVVMLVMMFVLIFFYFRKQISSGNDDIQQFFDRVVPDRFRYDPGFRIQFFYNGYRILYGFFVCDIGM